MKALLMVAAACFAGPVCIIVDNLVFSAVILPALLILFLVNSIRSLPR